MPGLATIPFRGDVTSGDVDSAKRLVPFGNHPAVKQLLNLWLVPEAKEAVR